MRKYLFPIIFVAIAIGVLISMNPSVVGWVVSRFTAYSVFDRLVQYQDAVRTRLQPSFDQAGVAYPPKKVVLAFFKDTKILNLYASDELDVLRFIKSYPVIAASGKSGPKLREGDRQVPEGIYRVEALNPNSAYHLALRLSYPNYFDHEMGTAEGRDKLGSDIMIHGNQVSIGCLAMGDSAIEELFILAAIADWPHWQVLLAPTDLRVNKRAASEVQPAWVSKLDEDLRAELGQLP